MTEQKVQSNGQPREVWMGMVGSPMPWTPIFFIAAHVQEPEIGEGEAVQVLDGRRDRVLADDAVLLPGEPGNIGERAAGIQRLDEQGKTGLAFARDAVVPVLERLVGQEGHVGTAEYHGDSRSRKWSAMAYALVAVAVMVEMPDEVRVHGARQDLLAGHEEGFGRVAAVAHDGGQEDGSQPWKLELGKDVQVIVLRLDERYSADHAVPSLGLNVCD